MIRLLKTKKGQTSASEYTLTIFLVIATFTAMTIYLQRALQARIYDARGIMLNIALQYTGNAYDGHVYKYYEPYYMDTSSQVSRDSTTLERIYGHGITHQEEDSLVSRLTSSVTAPAREYKNLDGAYSQ